MNSMDILQIIPTEYQDKIHYDIFAEGLLMTFFSKLVPHITTDHLSARQ